ncbi:MAG: sulfotransferase family 2 domain-containing protein [Saprospiraceae bacterium]|nr:sulfotransferase family 2 domain-containing protein [Saprospiraceae bacterium]
MSIKGQVNFNNAIGFGGLIWDEENSGPNSVSLYINDNKVATTLATATQSELLNGEVETINKYSFIFYYSEIPSELLHHNIHVVGGPLEVELSNSPIQSKVPETYHSDSNSDRFFFLHVPKTAGTSFQQLLNTLFRQQVIFPNTADIHRNGGRYPDVQNLLQRPDEHFNDIRLLCGHLPASAASLMPPITKRLAFLRDPYQRAISNLNYSYLSQADLNSGTIEEAYDKLRDRLFNLQTRYFADSSVSDLIYFRNPHLLDDQGLQQAKETLEEFEFIGITEHFEDSINLIAKTFNWRFVNIPRVNVTKQKIDQALPETIKDQIKLGIKYDLELYQFALDLYDKRKNSKRKIFTP